MICCFVCKWNKCMVQRHTEREEECGIWRSGIFLHSSQSMGFLPASCLIMIDCKTSLFLLILNYNTLLCETRGKGKREGHTWKKWDVCHARSMRWERREGRGDFSWINKASNHNSFSVWNINSFLFVSLIWSNKKKIIDESIIGKNLSEKWKQLKKSFRKIKSTGMQPSHTMYICFQGRYHNYDFSIEFFFAIFLFLKCLALLQ